MHSALYSSQLPWRPNPMTSYGAGPQPHMAKPAFTPRRHSHVVAMALCMVVPWLLFCLMYVTLSFSVHYRHVYVCIFILFVGLLVVAATAVLAIAVWRRRNMTGSYGEASWFCLLFVLCLLAWGAAVVAGDYNYTTYLEPYYDTASLNNYPDVDPSRGLGNQLMDAGRVSFTPGAKLDLSKAMSFKNMDRYCVAPIIGFKAPAGSYDFWAVGKNCCSGKVGDFRCGDYSKKTARAGLRLMRDEERAFYRLAVQQSEATYNIRASHPLFFYWSADPTVEMDAYWSQGFTQFLLACFGHFVLQICLVGTAAFAIAKLNSRIPI